jgi:hypothetical protein
MTPTALSGISPAAAASSQTSPQQYACPFPPFDLTASTAIASVLAGVTTGALAYMSGFDTAYAMLTGLAVFAGGMVLWVAETFSLMRQQQFLHSTMQHVVFNGAHVAVSGLLGNMPATVASTALAQQFAGPPVNISMNGNPAQESPRTELSAGGLALLLSSVAIPTYAVLFFSLRSLRAAAKRNEGHFSSASGTRTQRPLAHSVFKYLIDFGAPLIGTAAVLAAPALTLSCVVNNEAGTRYGILSPAIWRVRSCVKSLIRPPFAPGPASNAMASASTMAYRMHPQWTGHGRPSFLPRLPWFCLAAAARCCFT